MTADDKKEETRKRSLELALAQIDKEMGKGSIMRLGNENIEPWPSISTGALTLDLALGIGGIPRGRIIEIYGPESSGKSTISLSCVAQVQDLGEDVAYIDAEHSLDPGYMRNMGVNLDELLLAQPSAGEDALKIVDTLVKSAALSLIVVDSVAALTPRAELEGDMGQSHVGLQARMMSQALRKLTGLAAETNTSIIFINQLREKIGVMFGNPETTPGGKALKFYSSVRLDVRKIETIKGKEDGLPAGLRTRVKVIKNKMAPALRMAEFDILYGRGINTLGCVLDLAVDDGLIKKSGAWFSTPEGEQLGQGRDNAIGALASDLAYVDQLRKKILEHRGV